ncbi:MAG: cell division protein FtsQ/DivIB [Paracoccaceae bacterium]|nr:MAG: cell division protein FtsQ/DivIB [Paracoccaceae bacterium]
MRSLIRRPPDPLRRDPAPSRWSYRMHRLWLTPVFRRVTRVGIPAFVITFATGLYLADEARRMQLTEAVVSLRDEVKNRPQFMVTLMSVEGASPALAETVRQALALPLPLSSLDLDLDAARQRVEGIDAVASALLRVQPGGVLQVAVTEREPAVVWRGPQGLILLDDTGHRIAALETRAERADLPLIAGEGAEHAVPEALSLILSSGPLLPRLRGLVRLGDRRWDLVLDRDQRILLPQVDPLSALERFIAIDMAQSILSRDLVAVDLRHPDRPVLRLSTYALVELRRQRGILPPETDL